MKRIIFVTFCTSLFFTQNIFAQNKEYQTPDKQTFIYSVKGIDTLRLDKYSFPSNSELKPCIVFMFGGGFFTGQRDWFGFTDYFKHFAEKGYTVISIDYRLGLKNAGDITDGDPMRTAVLLNNSISMAVEDLFDATTFIINHSKEWNIDTNTIMASGSSAGAISVLHGEYNICNKTDLTKKLPENFRYAGIIAFAGAIFSTEGEIRWQLPPSPIQFFHGDADRNVPYNKIELFRFGFYGSKFIAGQLEAMNSPYYFYNVINAGHEIANSPMIENLEEVESFLNKYIKKKQPLRINLEVNEIGKSNVEKDFELMDYIRANWSK